jgi:hypothetical protein
MLYNNHWVPDPNSSSSMTPNAGAPRAIGAAVEHLSSAGPWKYEMDLLLFWRILQDR